MSKKDVLFFDRTHNARIGSIKPAQTVPGLEIFTPTDTKENMSSADTYQEMLLPWSSAVCSVHTLSGAVSTDPPEARRNLA